MHKKKKSSKYFLLIIALLVSLFFAWYMFSKSNTNINDNLYAEFYSSYPNIIDPLTKGERETLSVFQFYENRDFDKVLNELDNTENLSEEKSFYLAMTHLELENYEKADKVLSAIEKDRFRYDRDWYRALICLKLNRLGCDEMLKAISKNSNNSYSKKANSVLEKLK